MSKDPAFLFYYKDFENDTSDWEADAIGWYIRLLIFQAGNGYIPSDIEELAQVGRVKFSDYQKFCERWTKRLACKFITLSDNKLYNPKLSKVQSERKSSAIKKSVLAVFGNYIKSTNLSVSDEKILKNEFHKEKSFYDILDYETRKNKILNHIELILYQLKTNNAKRTQQEDAIENEDVNKDIVEIEIYPTFDDFWNEYDKKVGKDRSERLWKKIKQRDRELIMQHIPDYKLSQPDKQYRKNPDTYLNNESWNDEIIIPQQPNGTQITTINRQSAETYRKNGEGW